MPEVWAAREHPGLKDATSAYVFCPGFVDLALHLAVNSMLFPLYSVELAQVLEEAKVLFAELRHKGSVQELPEYGNQVLVCGARVLGMHLIRNFHTDVPCSLRLLDFWSGQPGLWGSHASASVTRRIPGRP